jgi:hypothetical protein
LRCIFKQKNGFVPFEVAHCEDQIFPVLNLKESCNTQEKQNLTNSRILLVKLYDRPESNRTQSVRKWFTNCYKFVKDAAIRETDVALGTWFKMLTVK